MKPRAYSYVRFSTPDQLKGDSFRRQSDLSRDYAAKHGLDLDESLSFQDLGVSAFKGKNVTEGALGAFMKAVKDGVIRAGSFLLVESLDRLSRDNVYDAFLQFGDILRHDINIVTLADGKAYTKESLKQNFSDLMISLATMFRAHEESLTKSKRLKAAWSAKRESAQKGGRKLTGRAPAWLRLDHAAGAFEVIEDRSKVVRRIFDMTLSGMGKGAIAKRFNEAKVPTFGRSTGWHPSYIQKILDSEAVVGSFQPMRMGNDATGRRRRVPDGDPIPDYFPAIVDPETFHLARQIRRDHRIAGGRKGLTFSNLFTGIAKCGLCGSPMHFINKGQWDTYLVCSAAKRGAEGCRYRSWRYPNLEKFILIGLQEVRYKDLFPSLSQTGKATVTALEGQRAVFLADQQKNSAATDNLIGLLEDRPDSKALLGRLDALEAERDELERKLAENETTLIDASNMIETAEQNHEETIAALAEWLLEAKGDPQVAFERRSRLHQLLKKTVNKIDLTPTEGDRHGDIVVSFKKVETFLKKITVETGQWRATAKAVRNGIEDLAGVSMAAERR